MGSRYSKFVRSKSRNLKEAAKIYEYTRTVERGLQTAEILQSINEKDNVTRSALLHEAGLVELKRVSVVVNKVTCIVTVLAPTTSDEGRQEHNVVSSVNFENSTVHGSNAARNGSPNNRSSSGRSQERENRKKLSEPMKFVPREMVVAIVEDSGKLSSGVAQLLRVAVRDQTSNVQLTHSTPGNDKDESAIDESEGVEACSLTVQPTMLALAQQALEEIAEFLLPVDSDSNDGGGGGSGEGGGESKDKNRENESNATVTQGMGIYKSGELSELNSSALGNSTNVATFSRYGLALPTRIRLIGHSAGGAVAALTAMLLDGGVLDGAQLTKLQLQHQSPGSSSRNVPTADSVSAGLASADNSSEQSGRNTSGMYPAVSKLLGSYSGRVQCVALGPPPCVGRAHVPRYISSIVCGDDVVPRAQGEALKALRARVLAALKAGAGSSGGALGYVFRTAGVLSDLTAIAGQCALIRYCLIFHPIFIY